MLDLDVGHARPGNSYVERLLDITTAHGRRQAPGQDVA